jgi:hypothetical protein
MESAVGLDSAEIRNSIVPLQAINNQIEEGWDSKQTLNPIGAVSSKGDKSSSAQTRDWRDDDESKGIFVEAVGRMYYVFCISGFVWKGEISFRSSVHVIWNFLVYVLVMSPGLFVCFVVAILFPDTSKFLVFWLVAASLLLQSAGIVLSTYWNSVRLSRKASSMELNSFWSTQSTSVVSVAVAIVATFLIPGMLAHSVLHEALLLLPSILVNGINIQFLLADATVAFELLRKVTRQARSGNIAFQDVELVRLKISEIVENGFLPTTAIMATALGNILCFFVIAVIREQETIEIVVYFFLVFFKEIVFAIVGLYYAACVNEAVQELKYTLGLKLSVPSNCSHVSPILHYLQVCPINFPVCGMVLTRKDVAIRFAVWVFGVVVSFVARLVK